MIFRQLTHDDLGCGGFGLRSVLSTETRPAW